MNRWVSPQLREAELPHTAILCQVRPPPLESKLLQERAFLFTEEGMEQSLHSVGALHIFVEHINEPLHTVYTDTFF